MEKYKLTPTSIAVMNMANANTVSQMPLGAGAVDETSSNGLVTLGVPLGWDRKRHTPSHKNLQRRCDVIVSLQPNNKRVRFTFRNGVLGENKPRKMIVFPDKDRISFFSADSNDRRLLQWIGYARDVQGETKSTTFPIMEFPMDVAGALEKFMGKYDYLHMYDPENCYGASFGGYILLSERKDRKKGEKL